MMLIDKDKALTAIAVKIRTLHNEDAIVVGGKIEEIGLITAFDIIKRLPIVEERAKGKWQKYHETGLRYECSVCRSRYSEPWHYCPNCGADMRGDKNDS